MGTWRQPSATVWNHFPHQWRLLPAMVIKWSGTLPFPLETLLPTKPRTNYMSLLVADTQTAGDIDTNGLFGFFVINVMTFYPDVHHPKPCTQGRVA